MPARYYSVKEAAKLFGVSTNTIYTWIKEGKLVGRRIGRGRIRIPAKELSLLLPQTTLPQPLPETYITSPQAVGGGVEEEFERFSESPTEKDGVIYPGKGDIIFYRLFRSLFLIGLGLIYLLTGVSHFFLEKNVFLSEEFLRALPFALIFGGVLILARVIRGEQFKKWDIPIHLYLTLVLGFLGYVSLMSGHFGLSVFVGGILTMTASHFTRGFHLPTQEVTFKSQFIKYSLILSMVGGVVVILKPELFPSDFLREFIIQNKTLFAFIWFFIFVPFFLYLLSPQGRDNKFAEVLIGILSIFALFLAVELSIKSTWDVSFLSFLTGIFGIILSGWEVSELRLAPEKIGSVVYFFIWILLSTLLGIAVIHAARERVKTRLSSLAESKINTLVSELDTQFVRSSALLTSFAVDGDLKKAILSRNEDILQEYAKKIYGKSTFTRRVVIFSEEGIALAAYPRNSLIEGTNFSSRDYFSKTKETYRSYISPVFKGVTGVDTVLQTEPVFENNKFIGMIGLAHSLNGLSNYLKERVGEDFTFYALDENTVYAVGSDEKRIGMPLNEISLREVRVERERIDKAVKAKLPNWNVQLQVPVVTGLEEVLDTNIIVYLILSINALLTAGIGIVFASESKGEAKRGSLAQLRGGFSTT